ncbi:MAG TPA: dephospho-CoA kinase [Dissulfurispiraceae bacterium]|nr:dephospho-CoA kinase [Dissulfurispiraceae bacterium]
MIVLGITGNIGMGKSTVSRMFEELGAVRIDADAVVSGLLGDPEVIREVSDLFGEHVLHNGVLDRKLLAHTVFSNSRLRLGLENILHPRVFKAVDAQVEELAKTAAPLIIVVEAPVLFERSYQNRFDSVLTVFTSEETALRRLEEKGMTRDDARKRIESQFPITMKREKADMTIDNNGTHDETREQVRRIYELLMLLEKQHGCN